MVRITLKGRSIAKIKASKVTVRAPGQQKGFIFIPLLLIILLFVMTPAGCAMLLAALTGTSIAVPP